jgi:uncharacterized membrane protein
MKNSGDFADGFRVRGGEVTRLESFSDAVFGFALTLLVVSLEVPKSFSDLMATMRGIPAFAVCFAMLATIWNTHYKYCRRYGLDDATARLLTCVLLFIVLLYIYPLKFLFTLGMNDLLFGRGETVAIVSRQQASTLLLIYSLGFAGVYLAFSLLYFHAWRLREALALSELERFDTRYLIRRLLSVSAFALVLAGLTQFAGLPPSGGYAFFLLFPMLRAQRFFHERQRTALIAAEPGK